MQRSGRLSVTDPIAALPGNYECRLPGATEGDSVVIGADGTITITQPSGLSASGTWTLQGNIVTVYGVGRGGQEDFTIQGDTIVAADGRTCTKVP